VPGGKADPRLLGRLQGEDGYEIFNDRDDDPVQRLRRTHDESRW
jgi:hypothetical protein